MANLGTLSITLRQGAVPCPMSAVPAYSTVLRTQHPYSQRLGSPVFPYDTTNLLTIPKNGVREGVVTIDGSGRPNVVMRLYSRTNGQLIDQVFTDATGHYKFIGLDPNLTNEYLIMAMDPALQAPFNYTLVHDHLTAQ